MALTIYPAIDLRRGRVVRLIQGDRRREIEYFADPLEAARSFAEAGARWLHVVDLDRAFGEGSNVAAIEKLCSTFPDLKFQVGGGLRTIDALLQLKQAGAARLVIGTAAFEEPEFLARALEHLGAPHLALALDVRDNRVTVRGWTESHHETVEGAVKHFAAMGIRYTVYTSIQRDGMLCGVDLTGLQAVLQAAEVKVIASGGVEGLGDLVALRQLGHPNLEGVIIGRALYENRLHLRQAFEVLQEQDKSIDR